MSGHSVCWRIGVWHFRASSPAFSRGRQLVFFQFKSRLPVPEHPSWQQQAYLFLSGNNVDDLISSVNKELVNVTEWLDANKLLMYQNSLYILSYLTWEFILTTFVIFPWITSHHGPISQVANSLCFNFDFDFAALHWGCCDMCHIMSWVDHHFSKY